MTLTPSIFACIVCSTLSESTGKPIELLHERRLGPRLRATRTQVAHAALDCHEQMVAWDLRLGAWR